MNKHHISSLDKFMNSSDFIRPENWNKLNPYDKQIYLNTAYNRLDENIKNKYKQEAIKFNQNVDKLHFKKLDNKAYIRFSAYARPMIRIKDSHLSESEINKLIQEAWELTPRVEKDIFVQDSRNDD